MNFAATIIPWYQRNKRDLPWRNTRDPYKIWLSEVILQQTRVQQGLSYYQAFAEKYPRVELLAKASEAEVLKLWQGLGYYSRARNLHATAKIISARGKFPDKFTEIIQLKGVGDYTAAAISSICFNEPQPVVDGNVYHMLSRVFGIDTPIDSTAGKKQFRELAAELLDQENPAVYNQAIMEFGALQCVPKSPDCANCPLMLHCEAFRLKKVDVLPVKALKTKVTDRFFYYLVIRDNGHLYLRQRKEKDIWQNLFDFPLLEFSSAINEKKLEGAIEKLLGSKKFKIVSQSPMYRHILSHQRLHVHFLEIDSAKKPREIEALRLIAEKQLDQFAVPVVIGNYLQDRLKNRQIPGKRIKNSGKITPLKR